MRTELCERLGIEFPIFAFTHCRDVVAAVSQAGGFGVLGALGFSAEQLEVELNWIDDHVGDKPYGVDIVIPNQGRGEQGGGESDPQKLEEKLRGMIPQGHRDFVRKLLAEHGVPELPEGSRPRELLGWTLATARPQLEVSLQHEKVRLIASALGTPPPDVIAEIQESGRLVAALSGAVSHALAHAEAGVDVIVAQGHEAGAHCGEIGSIVLWQQVVDAVAPTPVLAAGGVGSGRQIAAAIAMGAAGVWTGSIWLTVQEADLQPAQAESYLEAGSGDTVRSRSFTGKPNRMLRNAWTEAWDAADAPDPLGMPLQYMITSEAVLRTGRYASQSQDVAFHAVGQVVGMMNEVVSSRELIYRLAEEYFDAVERLQGTLPEDESQPA